MDLETGVPQFCYFDSIMNIKDQFVHFLVEAGALFAVRLAAISPFVLISVEAAVTAACPSVAAGRPPAFPVGPVFEVVMFFACAVSGTRLCRSRPSRPELATIFAVFCHCFPVGGTDSRRSPALLL